MGQDDSCGICGKADCWHLNQKEHLAYVHEPSKQKAAVCGQRGAILFDEGTDVDPDRVCRRCRKIAKERGIEI